MKKPAALSPSLVAVKGRAEPARDIPTRSPEIPAAAKPAPSKPKKETPLNFKMRDDFVLSFKSRAVQDRLKLNELLEACFASYCERQK